MLIVWLLAVELGVKFWFDHMEANLKPGISWTVQLPKESPDFQLIPITETTRNLLRYDDAQEATWKESDGSNWQVFYCNWLPGRVAGYLAKRHTPEICLRATGLEMVSGPELHMMTVNGVHLPVRGYIFSGPNGPLHVYHCRWEAGVDSSSYVEHESSRFNLIRAVWAGRGNKGQKVLEVVVTGTVDPDKIHALLEEHLKNLVLTEKH